MTEQSMARDADGSDDEGLSLLDLAIQLAENWKLLVVGPLLVGLVALGVTYLIAPTFTTRTVFLPPQQQQSAAASALGSLGALSSLAGVSTGFNVKSPDEQYAALMQSNTVADRMIDRFDLMKVYDTRYRDDARKDLAKNVRISVGKKDGLITVEVDDRSPQRAAAMANAEVEELRRLTSSLALTEAQQRRMFFEKQLEQTRDRLTSAQQALQASGFNAGALKAEPKAAADRYASLQAQVTAAEVRLQTLRRTQTDTAPDVDQQITQLAALRGQLDKVESASSGSGGTGYISKYREFKYEEMLFELLSRQFEIAKLDESREGTLIQVVDPAKAPERKSRPRRAIIAIVATLTSFLSLVVFVFVRRSWREIAVEPTSAEKIARLRSTLARR